MDDFNRLVSRQMMTMEKLLYLQAELERCQMIEEELHVLQNETQLESIQIEIQQMKKELTDIQKVFEQQTDDVIQSYKRVEITYTS